MKEKVKKFVEEHKAITIGVGIGAAVVTSGIIGHKIGVNKTYEAIRKWINDDKFCELLAGAIDNSKGLFAQTYGPDKIVKFKELGTVAKEAIEFDGSKDFLNDNIVGMFVLTNHEA